jgi:hypothetical protein
VKIRKKGRELEGEEKGEKEDRERGEREEKEGGREGKGRRGRAVVEKWKKGKER